MLTDRALLDGPRSHVGSVYLDLRTHYDAQRHGYPAFTPAVHVMMALRESLAELTEEGGWRVRRRFTSRRSQAVSGVLDRRGLSALVEPAHRASMLSAYWLPPSTGYVQVHDSLAAAGFVIYAGQGALAGRIFRIATMGAIGERDSRTSRGRARRGVPWVRLG